MSNQVGIDVEAELKRISERAFPVEFKGATLTAITSMDSRYRAALTELRATRQTIAALESLRNELTDQQQVKETLHDLHKSHAAWFRQTIVDLTAERDAAIAEIKAADDLEKDLLSQAKSLERIVELAKSIKTVEQSSDRWNSSTIDSCDEILKQVEGGKT